jgi:hypothetical protein
MPTLNELWRSLTECQHNKPKTNGNKNSVTDLLRSTPKNSELQLWTFYKNVLIQSGPEAVLLCKVCIGSNKIKKLSRSVRDALLTKIKDNKSLIKNQLNQFSDHSERQGLTELQAELQVSSTSDSNSGVSTKRRFTTNLNEIPLKRPRVETPNSPNNASTCHPATLSKRAEPGQIDLDDFPERECPTEEENKRAALFRLDSLQTNEEQCLHDVELNEMMEILAQGDCEAISSLTPFSPKKPKKRRQPLPRMILKPLHVNGNHWILTVLDIPTKSFIYFDPRPTHQIQEIVQKLKEDLQSQFEIDLSGPLTAVGLDIFISHVF